MEAVKTQILKIQKSKQNERKKLFLKLAAFVKSKTIIAINYVLLSVKLARQCYNFTLININFIGPRLKAKVSFKIIVHELFSNYLKPKSNVCVEERLFCILSPAVKLARIDYE